MPCCGQSRDGFLNINKPAGITSFGVVSRVRRLTGIKRVGHAGTLDPLATGVLPICLGQATRLVEYLDDVRKVYRAGIVMGISTDTYDAEGRVLETRDPSGVTLERIQELLPAFMGEIQQAPPAYSAVKIKGQPSYRLARAGQYVRPAARTATFYGIGVLGWEPPLLTVDVECGRGTYIRSLANDLGEALGCGAHLKSLERLRDGVFHVQDSVSLEQLQEAIAAGYWENLLYPIDSVIEHWPAVVLETEAAKKARNGAPVPVESPPGGLRLRAYTTEGCFLSVMKYDAEVSLWRPEKVFGVSECPGQGACPAGRRPCDRAATGLITEGPSSP